MKLQAIYARAQELSQAYYLALGLPKASYLENLRSVIRPLDLDRWPVVIRRQGEGQPWRVTLEHKPHAGTEWAEFDGYVKSATIVALCAHPNLKQLSRESGVQYATLWRAKDGRAITKGIIEMMGRVPDVVFVGPDGVIEDGKPILPLTLEQACAIPKRRED